MSIPPAKSLVPWTPIAQRQTWAPDEVYAADRSMECGQACVCMCLKWASGCWVPAAYLRYLSGLQSDPQAGTELAQLVDVLDLNETRADIIEPDAGSVVAACQEHIAQGHPVIVLRYFQYPGNSLLHYCCVVGYTPELVQMAGPWSGTMFTEDYSTFKSMYAGGLVRVYRHRMLGDH